MRWVFCRPSSLKMMSGRTGRACSRSNIRARPSLLFGQSHFRPIIRRLCAGRCSHRFSGDFRYQSYHQPGGVVERSPDWSDAHLRYNECHPARRPSESLGRVGAKCILSAPKFDLRERSRCRARRGPGSRADAFALLLQSRHRSLRHHLPPPSRRPRSSLRAAHRHCPRWVHHAGQVRGPPDDDVFDTADRELCDSP
jgi:hypothetical protein